MKEKKMNDREMRRQLDRYVRGALSTSEVDRLWAEILRNPEWLDELEANAAAQLLMQAKMEKTGHRQKSEGSPVPASGGISGGGGPVGSRTSPLRWMSAVALLMVLGLGFWLWETDQASDLPDRIELSEMVAPDIYRDNQRGYDDVDVWINEGLALALMEKPGEALDTYNDILREELTGVQRDAARLNLAILYYNDGSYERSRDEMNRFLAQSHEARPDRLTGKAWWILGLNQIRLEDPNGARHSFLEALAYEQVHRKQIEEWIESLDSR